MRQPLVRKAIFPLALSLRLGTDMANRGVRSFASPQPIAPPADQVAGWVPPTKALAYPVSLTHHPVLPPSAPDATTAAGSSGCGVSTRARIRIAWIDSDSGHELRWSRQKRTNRVSAERPARTRSRSTRPERTRRLAPADRTPNNGHDRRSRCRPIPTRSRRPVRSPSPSAHPRPGVFN